MEMRMVLTPPAPFLPVLPPITPLPSALHAQKVAPFGAWLLDQGKRPGSLGDLARAARLDRMFPKSGTADDVRSRFNAAGADGDAFAALDDAEREYDRQTR
jgi:hypothetical protein